MFAKVAIPIPTDKTFSYAIPQALIEDVSVGKRAVVPFGKRIQTGYIIEVVSSVECEDTKEIIEILDAEPLFHEEDLRFYRWVADYYIHPFGKLLGEILPAGGGGKTGRAAMAPKTERCIALRVHGEFAIRLTGKQASVVAFLERQGAVSVARLRREFGDISSLVKALQRKDVISVDLREILRSPPVMPDAGFHSSTFELNDDQIKAVDLIRQALASERFAPVLLHGVTGSGKTEVYIRAIAEAVKKGGGAIMLVPEIALTPQLLFRFEGRFAGERIAVLHSGISKAARYDQWRLIGRGDIRIVIGARSALFAPVKALRIIVVDEEHDASYKQDERLRYHARDLAVVKARFSGAAVILGSATPAVQTYYNVSTKKYRRIALPRRVEDRPLPAVEIVDMKQERELKGKGPHPALSQTLRKAIGETVASGKQVLLFLNRRGFHTFMLCLECGYVFKCRNCELSLTHHAAEGMLKCHYCDFTLAPPSACPGCRGRRIGSYGVGTEKLEEEVRTLFPSARVARMDSDTTARKGAYEGILKSLNRQEIDILVGTQMITKGHDFPGITLVGVVSADTALNIPDFRAAEKTFQLLTQVSGRGGRGDTPGLVIVQTFNPDHFAIRCARKHDYQRFYDEELGQRKALFYPPFSRLINVIISSPDQKRGRLEVEKLGRFAKDLVASNNNYRMIEIAGPAEAPIARNRGRYRWQLLLKGGNAKTLNAMVRNILSRAAGERLDVRVDVDPMSFM